MDYGSLHREHWKGLIAFGLMVYVGEAVCGKGTLSWVCMLPGNESNSDWLTVLNHNTVIKRGKTRWRKAVTGREYLNGKCIAFLWLGQCSYFCLYSNNYGWSCFHLVPSKSQSGSLWHWCSVKLLMLNRTPRTSCEWQASYGVPDGCLCVAASGLFWTSLLSLSTAHPILNPYCAISLCDALLLSSLGSLIPCIFSVRLLPTCGESVFPSSFLGEGVGSYGGWKITLWVRKCIIENIFLSLAAYIINI